MAVLNVFNFTTLNGFYKDQNDGISWHHHGKEESSLSEEGLAGNHILVFGRLTYEMMASFWPTEMALEQFPEVAKGMNAAEKIVFSRTMDKADWINTKVISDSPAKMIRFLKETSDKDLTILGSGTIVTQCAEAGLIDTFQLLLDPLALGDGTSIFSGMLRQLDFILEDVRRFKSGSVLLRYRAA